MTDKIYLNYAFEVEATNYCNANCAFCANSVIHRQRGFLDVKQFTNFIRSISSELDMNIFYYSGMYNYPRITFCGLGDPLLHPGIVDLISISHSAQLYTQLVTNGALLNREKLSSLIDAGLDEIAISFHSINSFNYYAVTGLNIEKLKSALIDCKDLLASIKTSFWRIKHPDEAFADDDYDQRAYDDFLRDIGLENCEILGPSEPWSRDGFVPNSKCGPVHDSPFWCNKILFTINIDWQGNLVLCCNDYNYEKVALGNVFDENFDYREYMRKKLKILAKETLPDMCLHCKRWSDTEIYSIIKESEIDSDSFFQTLQNITDKLNMVSS